jgi:hypothetical protein
VWNRTIEGPIGLLVSSGSPVAPLGGPTLLGGNRERDLLVVDSSPRRDDKSALKIDLLGQMVKERVVQGGFDSGHPALPKGFEILHGMPANFFESRQAAFLREKILVQSVQLIAQARFEQTREPNRGDFTDS